LRSSVSVRFYGNANSFGDRTYTTHPSDMSVDAMKIKREFEAFRECFDAIPDTLNRMPKMNPHGKDPLCVCVCVCVCVFLCLCLSFSPCLCVFLSVCVSGCYIML
jgi:hypothetical protein